MEQQSHVELTKYNKLPMEEIANKLFEDKRPDEVPKGKNKDNVQSGVNVTAMAEILASKFRGDEPVPTKKVPKIVIPLMAAKPESEFCVFCHKRVYIMERMSAEGVFFHRGCLKCDFCNTNLRLNNYSCDREISGEVKFYCYRHAHPDQRIRLKRKRVIYDDDGSKENIPTVVTMSMSKTGKDSVILPPQKKDETPKKNTPPLSPLQVPDDPYEKASKTPERVEFENTFEGLEEESEEEQFEHNLRASFSSDMLLDNEDDIEESDTDSDIPRNTPASGGEDDVLMEPTESDISTAMTWADACKLADSWSRSHSREDLASAGVIKEGEGGISSYSRLYEEGDDEGDDAEYEDEDEDDEEDTTEVEESGSEEDSTDVETEEEKSESHTRSEGTFQDTGEDASPLKSPSISAVLSARANFFATPPEPVRIDAMKALGLEEQQAKGAGSLEEEPSDRTQTDKTDNQVSEISEFEQNPSHASEDGGTDEDVLDVDIEEEDEAKVGSAMIDDEGEDADGEEEMEMEAEGNQKENEDLDKTAVSRAMEQLLKDMDNQGSLDSDQGEGRVVLTESEEEEEVFGEEGTLNKISEDTEQAVLRSVRDMRDTESEGDEGGTLQQVLQDVQDMDDKGREVKLDNIDDSFVTRRRKKKPSGKKVESSLTSDSESSFTISTPSRNSSTSSLNDEVEYNRNFCDDGDDDDLKPDADMLRDYTMTLSTALGESYSDSEMPSLDQEKVEEEAEGNTTLQGDPSLNDSMKSPNDSAFLTPTVNISKEEQPPSSGSDVFLTPEVNEKSEEGTPKAPEKSDMKLSPKKLLSTSTPKKTESPTPTKSESDNSSKTTPTKSKRIILSPVKITEPDSKPSSVPKPTPRKSDTRVSPIPSRLSPKPASRKSDSRVSPKPITTKTDSKSPKISDRKSECKVSPKPVPRKLPIPPNARGQSPRSPSSKTRTTTSTTSDSSSPSFSRPTTSSRAKWSDTDSRESSTSPAYSPAKTPKQTKTKIAVDRSRLKSDSSSEILTSDGAESAKKKIPLDRSLVKEDNPAHKSFEETDDIPFADESELDERFYTPATSVKARALPSIHKEDVVVRKRILPSPPRETTGIPSPDQIRSIQVAEKERNKIKAKDKPPVGEEGAGGIRCVNKTFQNPVVVRQGKKNEPSDRDRRSMSYSSMDPSTSDMVTDSDDSRLYGVHTPTSSAPETENTVQGSKEKRKKKSAESKTPKDKAEKEKKRKSFLLSKLLPGKSPEKTVKERSSTPTMSDSSNSVTKKKKTPKSDKKKRIKPKDVVDSSLSDNLKDLKIGSVFTTDMAKLPGNRPNFSSTMPLAPRAEVDDFSDSGESMMSTSTLHGRKSMNLTDKPDDRVSRRIQRAAQKQQKQNEHKRLRMAQEIQRKLEEVDVRQRELEQRGIIVEKALRGEGPDKDKDEADLMQEWFNLVHDKNSLVRYESELMVRAKELELEDRQARLENQLRERMSGGDPNKSDAEIIEEKQILDELLEVVEQRDSLVAMLEEDRLREQEEDRDLEEVMSRKGYAMSPLSLPEGDEMVDVS